MRIRSVLLACVCAAVLAAPAAVGSATAANQNSSDSLMVAARSALQAGDTATAIAGYSEAIEARDLAPEELANALINRGYAYQQAGEYERAADDYTAALRIDAMSGKLRATTLYNRGLSQQKLKQPVLAIEDFTSALFLEPEFAHAYYLRGTILRENGQLLFALSDFEKAIRFKHPQPHLAYYGEALAYEQLHRIGEAQAALNKAIAADPSFAPARDKLSELGALPAMSEVTVPQGEELITASIASPEQIVRKQELPDAVKPPAELVSELPVQMVKAVPVRPAKLFNDRIPPEDMGSMAAAVSEHVTTEEPAPASEASSEYTLQADAIPEPNQTKPEVAKSVPVSAKPVEQIVAVEALPEPAAQNSLTAEEASIEPAGEQVTAPAEQEASLTGWTIQLSSAKDEKLAWGTWDKLKTRHKVLSGMKPVVVRADLGTKGIYYRLRLGGFDSQADAQSLCGKLKSRGLSCFVSKASS